MGGRHHAGLHLGWFTVKDGSGENFELSRFTEIPVVLIVNVASHCSFTDRHYIELQTLRDEYDENELAIIAFPCNQFGGREPGTWEEIASLAHERYGTSFPIMGKVNVNGLQSDPLFAWLKAASGNPAEIPWNFTKFIVQSGDVVRRFSHEVGPRQIETYIRDAQG